MKIFWNVDNVTFEYLQIWDDESTQLSSSKSLSNAAFLAI